MQKGICTEKVRRSKKENNRRQQKQGDLLVSFSKNKKGKTKQK